MTITQRILISLLVGAVLAGPAQAQGLGKALMEALDAYHTRHDALLADEARATYQLSRWCLDKGLAEEGRRWLERVLFLEPGHEKATAELEKTGGEESTASGRTRATYKRRRVALMKRFAKKRLALARWCESQHLEGRASVLYEQILDLDPEHADARRALGFGRYKGAWLEQDVIALFKQGLVPYRVADRDVLWVTAEEKASYDKKEFPFGKESHGLREINQIRAEWKNAWKLRTRHFKIESNMEFDRLVRCAAQLELAYEITPRLWGLRTLTPPECYEIAWTRTLDEVLALLPGVDLGGGLNHYVGKKIYTYRHLRAGQQEHLASRKFFESLVQTGPGDIGLIQNRPAVWGFYGVAGLMVHLRPEGKAWAFDMNLLRAQQGQRTLEFLKSEGDDPLEVMNGKFVGPWDDRFYRWWATTQLFVGFLFETEKGRLRPSLRDFVRVVCEGEGTQLLFEQIFARRIGTFRKPFRDFVKRKARVKRK